MPIHLLSAPEPLALLERMLVDLKDAPAGPFVKNYLVIPHPGFAAWLKPRIAEIQGVWALDWMGSGRDLMWQIIAQVLPPQLKHPQLEALESSYLLQVHLPEWQTHLPPVERYLQGQFSGPRFAQLCQQLAHGYDRYSIYKPEWIVDWNQGQSPHWQAQLWQDLKQCLPRFQGQSWDRLECRTLFLARLNQASQSLFIPRRIFVYQPPYHGPFYTPLWQALGQWSEIYVYQTPLSGPLAEAPLSQMSQTQWQGLATTHENIKVPLLSQGALAQLKYGSPPEIESTSGPVTLQIHSCHSPEREVEICKQILYQSFQTCPDLEPGQVAICVPKLEDYAALFEAHFNTLPLQILQGKRSEDPLFLCYLSILELAQSRMTLPQVMAVLEQESILRSFGLSRDDLHTLLSWLEAVQVRWGLDAAHREQMHLPGLMANTWKKGLQRLLLGYAEAAAEAFPEFPPHNVIEGSEARILGQLLAFFDALSKTQKRLSQSQSIGDWAQFLLELLHRFLKVSVLQGRHYTSLIALQSELSALFDLAELYTEPLHFSQVQALLQRRWQATPVDLTFTEKITLGTYPLLQGLPFKVLLCCGLNQGEYPGKTRASDLDLLPDTVPGSAQQEQAGLFQAWQACTQRLHLLYQGRRIRDNQALPAAAAVEMIRAQFHLPLLQHPLKAYDLSYFQSKSPFPSYSQQAYQLAQAVLAPRNNLRAFIQAPLPTQTQSTTLPWQDLQHFFANPARFFLKRRLHFSDSNATQEFSDTEAFTLQGLDSYALRQSYITAKLMKESDTSIFQAFRAQDQLPLGQIQASLLSELFQSISQVFEALGDQLSLPREMPFEFLCQQQRIYGVLQGVECLDSGVQVSILAGKVRASVLLRQWLKHLLFNEVQGPVPSWIYAEDPKNKNQYLRYQFDPVENAQEILQTLLSYFHQGQNQVLPFAPKTSEALFQMTHTDSSNTLDIRALETVWFGTEYFTGEAAYESYALCLPEAWYLSTEALKMSQCIFGPLHAHWQALEGFK